MGASCFRLPNRVERPAARTTSVGDDIGHLDIVKETTIRRPRWRAGTCKMARLAGGREAPPPGPDGGRRAAVETFSGLRPSNRVSGRMETRSMKLSGSFVRRVCRGDDGQGARSRAQGRMGVDDDKRAYRQRVSDSVVGSLRRPAPGSTALGGVARHLGTQAWSEQRGSELGYGTPDGADRPPAGVVGQSASRVYGDDRAGAQLTDLRRGVGS